MDYKEEAMTRVRNNHRLEDINAVTTKTRCRMAVSERAKRFMPYKAVSGLDEALEMKRLELGIVERRELSEEELAELNKKFADVKKGNSLMITYFQKWVIRR